MSTFLLLVCSSQISSGLMKWVALNKTAQKRPRNGHFQIDVSLFMPTTLYFSYFHTNSIAMLCLVHKYKKKLESTNMDLTHSKIMIFSSFSS